MAIFEQLEEIERQGPATVQSGPKQQQVAFARNLMHLSYKEYLKVIIRRGVDYVEKDGEAEYYDLEFCKAQLEEIERQERRQAHKDKLRGIGLRIFDYVRAGLIWGCWIAVFISLAFVVAIGTVGLVGDFLHYLFK